MLTVEVKNAAGQTPLQFDILPSAGLPRAVVESQFQLARQLAGVLGVQYYFLVTTDWIRGWRMVDGALVFEQPAPQILSPYVANDAARVRAAGPNLLAELTQAWIASVGRPLGTRRAVPGEAALAQSGALAFIRSATTATTGSL